MANSGSLNASVANFAIQEAATLASVYLTAIYSIFDLANTQKGHVSHLELLNFALYLISTARVDSLGLRRARYCLHSVVPVHRCGGKKSLTTSTCLWYNNHANELRSTQLWAQTRNVIFWLRTLEFLPLTFSIRGRRLLPLSLCA